MVENKRYNYSWILVFFLALFFLSVFVSEKEKESLDDSICSIEQSNYNHHAVITAPTLTPEINISWIKTKWDNIPLPGLTADGKIKLTCRFSGYFSNHLIGFFPKQPTDNFCFLPKIPGREKGDDPLPLI